MVKSITKPQIVKIWACAHALGLDRELLYLLVPRGSISSMTKREASELIEHLTKLQGTRFDLPPQDFDRGRGKQPPSGPDAPSPEQRNFIYFLFGKIGWLQQPARMRGFLRKFLGVTAVEDIPDRKKAIALIEALKAIYKRTKTQRKDIANHPLHRR